MYLMYVHTSDSKPLNCQSLHLQYLILLYSCALDHNNKELKSNNKNYL